MTHELIHGDTNMRKLKRNGSIAALVILTGLLTITAQSRELPDFTTLVEESSPAVVNISTSQKQTLPEMPDLPEDSPFNEYFRRFFGEGQPRNRESTSLGSGFIISSDGYVITNNHVIRDAEEIIVSLSDRRAFKAELVGMDEQSDVALLKIDVKDLPVVKLGLGYDLKVGEWVLAIGSPFGFDHSVTAGIVSAKGRSLPSENYVPFIQTDVAINPGNSGGPLFNLDGEVVGVNSQIYSRTGTFMGLSFAIPIEVAMNVADQLRSQGRVSRGWLGVLIQPVTAKLAESFGMDKPQGAAIAKVLPGSPAEKAGLQVGDVVLAFNEHRVARSSDLPPIVGSTSVGSKVPVEILREGKIKVVQVLTAELPDESELQMASLAKPRTATVQILGLTVSDLNAEQRESLDVPKNGVLVQQVEGDPAREAGVQTGDVILMLNSEHVKDAEHFSELAQVLPGGKAVRILVQRNGNPIFLPLTVE